MCYNRLTMKDYPQLKKELLRDKKTQKIYNALEPEYALVEALIRKRLERGVTQKELAEKIGSKQSAISRLESGSYNPSVAFLRKVARALDCRLHIHLV